MTAHRPRRTPTRRRTTVVLPVLAALTVLLAGCTSVVAGEAAPVAGGRETVDEIRQRVDLGSLDPCDMVSPAQRAARNLGDAEPLKDDASLPACQWLGRGRSANSDRITFRLDDSVRDRSSDTGARVTDVLGFYAVELPSTTYHACNILVDVAEKQTLQITHLADADPSGDACSSGRDFTESALRTLTRISRR
ncbi:MAG: DUF3558 family protein [Pseudonocardia sp.]|uniref:DUF3558 family protein n=1 Tax=unclassified Pseudonocardia TaxID=2619320 RepID=UPI00086CB0CB|nr:MULTISPECIES: DUF3558 family protein [unclassified Pseudonocardia]MBN9113340.1 DUF3558 family protein [Pseudonocardia sp.]ODU23701.1 MAG: hypothetical protein ABS80_14115 [Pseudonocardia sp. SCN 72-51]ODV02002.1 MAG: hypothetical protein ABT15_26520 [Pseudonocardia sp. SCN 73-27]